MGQRRVSFPRNSISNHGGMLETATIVLADYWLSSPGCCTECAQPPVIEVPVWCPRWLMRLSGFSGVPWLAVHLLRSIWALWLLLSWYLPCKHGAWGTLCHIGIVYTSSQAPSWLLLTGFSLSTPSPPQARTHSHHCSSGPALKPRGWFSSSVLPSEMTFSQVPCTSAEILRYKILIQIWNSTGSAEQLDRTNTLVLSLHSSVRHPVLRPVSTATVWGGVWREGLE